MENTAFLVIIRGSDDEQRKRILEKIAKALCNEDWESVYSQVYNPELGDVIIYQP